MSKYSAKEIVNAVENALQIEYSNKDGKKEYDVFGEEFIEDNGGLDRILSGFGSYTLTLQNGDTVDVTSIHEDFAPTYDGQEVGIVFKVSNGQYFLSRGVYSSWDDSDYDDFEEVARHVEMVEKVTYTTIK